MSYAPVKFEVALFNGLGGDRITRNMMGGQRTDRLWYEINITIFLKEKSGYNNVSTMYMHAIIVQLLFIQSSKTTNSHHSMKYHIYLYHIKFRTLFTFCSQRNVGYHGWVSQNT